MFKSQYGGDGRILDVYDRWFLWRMKRRNEWFGFWATVAEKVMFGELARKWHGKSFDAWENGWECYNGM